LVRNATNERESKNVNSVVQMDEAFRRSFLIAVHLRTRLH